MSQAKLAAMYKRKADAVISTRVDSRTLALIAKYFYNEGLVIPSKGGLVRLALEELRKIILQATDEEDILSVEDARNYLDMFGIGDTLNPMERGRRNLLIKLQEEQLRFDAPDPSTRLVITKHERRKQADDIMRQAEIAVKLHRQKQLEKDEIDWNDMEEIKRQLSSVPSNVVVVKKEDVNEET